MNSYILAFVWLPIIPMSHWLLLHGITQIWCYLAVRKIPETRQRCVITWQPFGWLGQSSASQSANVTEKPPAVFSVVNRQDFHHCHLHSTFILRKKKKKVWNQPSHQNAQNTLSKVWPLTLEAGFRGKTRVGFSFSCQLGFFYGGHCSNNGLTHGMNEWVRMKPRPVFVLFFTQLTPLSPADFTVQLISGVLTGMKA